MSEIESSRNYPANGLKTVNRYDYAEAEPVRQELLDSEAAIRAARLAKYVELFDKYRHVIVLYQIPMDVVILDQ